MSNPILNTDSYKVSHYKQVPPKTTEIYSYLEARSKKAYSHSLFMGLQAIIDKYISQQITLRHIAEAEEVCQAHFAQPLFNRAGWERIVNTHGGYMPIAIYAVDEGSVIPNGNALVTVRNTDRELPWVTNYIETVLSQVWYPITVATRSAFVRNRIDRAVANTTGWSKDDCDAAAAFMLHDFGFRGASSVESAAIGGGAHLVNFLGTDTMVALTYLRDHYGAKMAGFSIPAAEHSTITSWTRSREFDAYANMLTQFPTGIVAIVSDSYDIYNAVANVFCGTLRERVETRDGMTVIRPDSGDPVIGVLKILHILAEKGMASTWTPAGYRLFDKVRVIWGDGMNENSISDVLDAVENSQFSAANLAFGMGGGLLQQLNRDTMAFAFKCSHAIVANKSVMVSKSPIDMPEKASKAGYLSLVKNSDFEYETVSHDAFLDTVGDRSKNLMQLRWSNYTGMQGRQTLDEIRALATYGRKAITR